MGNNKIKTKNSDGTISEIEVSFDVQAFNKENFWKEDWHQRKTKNDISFDELALKNEDLSENYIAKLPVQLTNPSPEDEVIAKIESEILHKAIDKLSIKQKRRIILRYFRNFTFLEIAAIERCNVSSVKRAIGLGLQNLIKILEKINK